MIDLSNLTVKLVPAPEPEEDYEIPPYGKRDWLLVQIFHEIDSSYYPLVVADYAYGGHGSCFWIHEEVGFDWWINQHFTIDTLAEGWWIIEDITADYIRGDGWSTDDDVDYDYGFVRPATQGEIDILHVNTCTMKE